MQKCGLFIDQKYFFLGASPDGLFEEGIVEMKCPYSARNMDAEQAILQKKIKFWKIDGSVNTTTGTFKSKASSISGENH